MKELHLITQGKGGVGKSYVAALLAQYFKEQQVGNIYCFDTDPVNQTFTRYQKLEVSLIKIINEYNRVDERIFDELIEHIINQDGITIVDNGAATFLPLMAYFEENKLLSFLADNGIKTIFHIPIQGGQALEDTISGLNYIVSSLNAQSIVWLNNFLSNTGYDVDTFKKLKIYKDNAENIIDIVNLINRNPDTFGQDLKSMTSANLTFDEVSTSNSFSIMSKQRIKNIKNDIFNQLNNVFIRSNE